MAEIAIIIVTYEPNIKLLRNIIFEMKKRKGTDLYLIDNASSNNEEISQILLSIKNKGVDNSSHIFSDFLSKNLGIATAQNIGLKKVSADSSDYKYVFFMDQDSFIKGFELDKLIKDFKNFGNNDLAALGTQISGEGKMGFNDDFTEVNELISSGTLIRISALKKIGYMREDLFIDFVDFEWCWRAKNMGWKLFKDNKVELEHQLSPLPKENKKKNFSKVAPFRLYYVFRNATYLMMNSLTLNNKVSNFYILLKLFRQFLINLFFSPDKLKRLEYMLKGIGDGLKGKMGRLNG